MENENAEEKIRQAVLAIRKSSTNPAGRHWLDVAEGFLVQALALSSPHPEAREEDIAESEAISHELGAGRFVHGISKPIEISQDDEPIIWQLDFAATLPWGEEITGVESEGSWFLIDQRGKVWEYGPMKTPAPLGNEYTRAIPLLKVGDNYMTWAEILSRLAAPKPEGRTISWQLINDIIDETLEEEAAPLECAIQVILAANGYTAINEPAAPEPRPAEEPSTGKGSLQVEPVPVQIEDVIQASEVKKAMEYNGRAICDWNGARDTLAAEVRSLRSQLARKDEGLRVCGNCEHGKSTSLDDTRCYKATPYLPVNRHSVACAEWEACHPMPNLHPRAALREPDGRKGE